MASFIPTARDAQRLQDILMYDLLVAENGGEERVIDIDNDCNFWGRYRNRNHIALSNSEVMNNRRSQNYPSTVQTFQGRINPRIPHGPLAGESDAWPRNQQPRLLQQKLFMDRNPTEFGGSPGLWQGVRFLGESSTASVGLWKYMGDRRDLRSGADKVVVKEAQVQNGVPVDLNDEAHMLRYLRHANSQHINRHIGHCALNNDDTLADRPQDSGKVGRIFIEYCPLGDLNALINYRRWSQKPFDEITLWKLFECLVDGFTVLESGNEVQINPATGWPDQPAERRNLGRDRTDPILQDKRNPWQEIIHFDVKAANMFLARVSSHSETPILKLGDFGSAKYLSQVTPENYADDDARAAERRRGTTGHHPPEQFTERWDYKDWQESQVAGHYTTKTNVWGIGNVIHEALTLRTHKLPISRPFKPAFPIFGRPSLGLTYDDTLTLYTEYSQMLRDTIWSCLYEKPAHRLSLYELKCRVVEGKKMAIVAAKKAVADFPRVQAEAAAKLQADRARFLAEWTRDVAICRRNSAINGAAEPTLVKIPDPPPLKAPRIYEPWEDFQVPFGPEIQIDPHPFGRPDVPGRLIPRRNAQGFLVYDPVNGVLYDPPDGDFTPTTGHLLYYPGNKLFSVEANSYGPPLSQNLLDTADYRPKPTTYNVSNQYYTTEYYTPVSSLPVAAPDRNRKSKPPRSQQQPGPYRNLDQDRRDSVMASYGISPQLLQPPFSNFDPHFHMPDPPAPQQFNAQTGLRMADPWLHPTTVPPYSPNMGYRPPPQSEPDPQNRQLNQGSLRGNGLQGRRIPRSIPPDNQRQDRSGNTGVSPTKRRNQAGENLLRNQRGIINKSNSQVTKKAHSPLKPSVTPQSFPVLGTAGPVVPKSTPKRASGQSDADRLNDMLWSASDNSGDSGLGQSGRKGKKVVYKPWDGQ